MMFGVILRVIRSKVEPKCFLPGFGKKPWANPLGFGSKFQIFFKFLYRKKEPRNDVWGYFQSDWKQSGTKEFLSRFWQKNHGLTPWDLVQNFKFSKTFSTGKKEQGNDVLGYFKSDWKQS